MGHFSRLLLIFFTLSFFSYGGIYSNYINKKIGEFAKVGTVNVGDFQVVAIPVPYQVTILTIYEMYQEKGLKREEIIKKLKNEYKELKKSGIPYIVVFIYKGNDNNVSLKLPNSFRDYAYIENGYGKKGRLKYEKIPLKRTLNIKNRKVIVNLIFGTTDSRGNSILRTSALYLNIKDILPGNIRIKYSYPFSLYFKDAPTPIREILEAVEN